MNKLKNYQYLCYSKPLKYFEISHLPQQGHCYLGHSAFCNALGKSQITSSETQRHLVLDKYTHTFFLITIDHIDNEIVLSEIFVPEGKSNCY